jgi:hypothetical protein
MKPLKNGKPKHLECFAICKTTYSRLNSAFNPPHVSMVYFFVKNKKFYKHRLENSRLSFFSVVNNKALTI